MKEEEEEERAMRRSNAKVDLHKGLQKKAPHLVRRSVKMVAGKD